MSQPKIVINISIEKDSRATVSLRNMSQNHWKALKIIAAVGGNNLTQAVEKLIAKEVSAFPDK